MGVIIYTENRQGVKTTQEHTESLSKGNLIEVLREAGLRHENKSLPLEAARFALDDQVRWIKQRPTNEYDEWMADVMTKLSALCVKGLNAGDTHISWS